MAEDYVHSYARFYKTGCQRIYNIKSYSEMQDVRFCAVKILRVRNVPSESLLGIKEGNYILKSSPAERLIELVFTLPFEEYCPLIILCKPKQS